MLGELLADASVSVRTAAAAAAAALAEAVQERRAGPETGSGGTMLSDIAEGAHVSRNQPSSARTCWPSDVGSATACASTGPSEQH